jgi:hypothetical protein
VLLKSNCTENVVVTGGRRVWIAPDGSSCPFAGCTYGGPALRITAAAAGSDVVNITGPQDVTLVHLILSGGSTGLHAVGNANVTAYDVSADDNRGAGFSADTGSALALFEGGARRNGWYGLTVGEGSTATILGQAVWLHNQPITFTGNRGGILVDRSVLEGAAGILVDGNAGPGLSAFGANVIIGAFVGETTIENNKGGVMLSEHSQATLWRNNTGATTVRNNGNVGVYVEKSSEATLFEVLVEGHTGIGVDDVIGSRVSLHGARILGNGPTTGRGGAGIRVDGNSHLFIAQAEVAQNRGPGILADLSSSVDARAAVVNGNHREGFRVLEGSFLILGSESSVGPNGGPAVRCDETSHVTSSIVSRSHACSNVERPTQPRPVRPTIP